MSAQFYAPLLTKTNKILVIVFGVSLVLDAILKSSGLYLAPILGLSLETFIKGMIYQVVTYPLIQYGLMGTIFNCLVFWFFGGELETRWGQKLYLSFLATAVIGGALVYLLVVGIFFSGQQISSIPLIGINGMCFAILMAYGIIFSDNIIPFMLIFPMKAKYFCMILVGIELYLGFFSSHGQVSWAHLGGMALAYGLLWWKSYAAKKARFIFEQSRKKRVGESHLRLVDKDKDNKDDEPKYWQ